MDVFSHTPEGFEGTLVRVEADLRRGIPGFDMSGLPGPAVREARERVRAALRNGGFAFPLERILVNLCPSDLPKTGSGFDLALALVLLDVSGQIKGGSEKVLCMGELQLSGAVRPVPGVLSAAVTARDQGVRHLVLSPENAEEVRILQGLRVHPVSHLVQLADFWSLTLSEDPGGGPETPWTGPDLRNYLGQSQVRKALAVSAAGGHNLLLLGPPGVGKTLAARCLEGILPPWSSQDALETTRLWSLAGLRSGQRGLLPRRPFRKPHHSASLEGLVGGGPRLSPGEISLAHHGVLFLDEAPEYRTDFLQGLREPLEEGAVNLVRAGRKYYYPSRFQLVATANPCPCGQLGRPEGWCLCSPQEKGAYIRRIGGALLDRFDIRLEVGVEGPPSGPQPLSTAEVHTRVTEAYRRSLQRNGGRPNSLLTLQELLSSPRASPGDAREFFTREIPSSTRSQLLVWRLARTLADLKERDTIAACDFQEAGILHGTKGGNYGWF